MDVQRVESLLRQMQQATQKKEELSPARAFWDLIQEASERGMEAGKAAERFLATGEGELHRVQTELAKADITFRFLVEVRNKLTEAYQEISRLNM